MDEAIVLPVFGVGSDMTRIEFKRKFHKVGLYYLITGKVKKKEGCLRVPTKTESEQEVEDDRGE